MAYDATKYNVEFSPVVQAITKSRLYDGSNISDNELEECEKTIAQAKGKEKEFIITLYTMMRIYKDPEFHHHLWYGLLCIQDRKIEEAQQIFTNIVNERGYCHNTILSFIKK